MLLVWPEHPVKSQHDINTESPVTLPINTLYDTSSLLLAPKYIKPLSISPDTAEMLHREFMRNTERYGFSKAITTFSLDLSRILADQGSYTSGIAVLMYALPYAMQSPHTRNMVTLLHNNIGNMYLLMGKYMKATQAYHQAIRFAEQNPAAFGIEYAYANMVGIFNLYNKHTEGLYYLDKAEKLAIRRGNQNLLENIIINRGIIYMRQGNTMKAEQQFLTALKWAQDNDRPQLHSHALKYLAKLQLENNQPEKALPYIEQAFQDSLDNSYYEQLYTLITLGETYMAQHRYKEAEQILLKALTESEKKQMNAKKAALHQLLSTLYNATGKYKEAYEHNMVFARALNELKSLEIADNLNELEVRYRTAEKDKELLQKQIQITQQEQDLKNKNIWIIGISTTILISLFLFTGAYRTNRHRQQISQLKASISGEEKERTRIARDLHDGIGGMLASLKMHFSTLPANHHTLSKAPDYQEAMQILDETANEVRITAHNLMPELLMRYGFEEAMRIFCTKSVRGSNLSINFQCLGLHNPLNKNIELSLYRMVQELVQNIIKHADATKALVQVNLFEKQLDIMVEDNGKGINRSTRTKGMGLESLRQRVKTLKGNIEIDSTPDKGTTVYLQFDIDKINFS